MNLKITSWFKKSKLEVYRIFHRFRITFLSNYAAFQTPAQPNFLNPKII